MPPFSPVWNGFLPNSTNSKLPIKPCQPSVVTQGGSILPVEPPAPRPLAVQSASAQYTAPGTRRGVGTGIASVVFTRWKQSQSPPPSAYQVQCTAQMRIAQ